MWGGVLLPILLIEFALYKLRPVIEFEKRVGKDEELFVFRRKDVLNISRLKLYTVGIPLLIPRFVLVLLCVVLDFLVCKLILLGWSLSDEPVSGWRKRITYISHRLLSRLLLLSLGFFKITERGEPDARACVMISNHVSYLDILYFMSSSECPSFVAKHNVRQYPCIGRLAESLQCIFVNRLQGRKEALEMVIERQRKIANDTLWPKLLVFPEGTTTNGRGVLPFKRGAFMGLMPVQPICVEYPYNSYSPAFEVIPMLVHIILLSCQVYNNLEVTRLPLVEPRGRNVEDYAEFVREQIANRLKVPKVPYTYENKISRIAEIFTKTKAKTS